ncbi:tetratricopeptide repeat protein [Nonomuraea sp. JJY05]|uniref:tetratricopeptide repeat protein n=1 Tax=Nonomuraea sp. JJY05 TaxID=3350255 RepID=UPI00373E26F0
MADDQLGSDHAWHAGGGQVFKASTSAARLEAFSKAAGELTRRGLDATALVRHGMCQQVLGALIANLTAMRLAPHWGLKPFAGFENFDHDSWAKVLRLPPQVPIIEEEDPRKAAEDFVKVITPLIPRVMSWVSLASLQDMVCLTPPKSIRELPQEEIAQFFELQVPYQWMVDYFSRTFLHEWETKSLHLTHRWIKGLEGPPCSPELMEDRRIEPDLLAHEIADRATSQEDRKPRIMRLSSPMLPPPEAPSTRDEATAALVMGSLIGEMTRHATRLLRQGRLREAAAVFEFGVQGAPGNPDLHNNWGFCLIPLEPREALKLLTKAKALGYRCEAINLYNQVCCMVSLGRHKAALSLAASAWDRIKVGRSLGGTIWQMHHSGWMLADTENACRDLAALAVSVATSHGWQGEAESWNDRIADLGAP